MKNNAKNMSPSSATPSQSRRGGQRLRNASAIGSNRTKPPPKRKAAIATGSTAPTMKRVATAAKPPSVLDNTAAATPSPSVMRALRHRMDENRVETDHVHDMFFSQLGSGLPRSDRKIEP